ncbi:MAG: glycosyltransferase family 2 protein [Deltaproteobacteria bacterium]|nr:MAG: glycosyltransferase family 2 protein [Deltaproteobacteria bacterium]
MHSTMNEASENPDIELSIVIPAYNEAERIEPTLERILAFLDTTRIAAEVLVVDDGSTDATAQVVTRFVEADRRVRLLANASNRGKGYTVKHGILEAKGEWVLFSDADLSTPIEDYERLAAFRDDYDIVIGSRALPDSRVEIHQPFYREWMGKIFNRLVQAIVLSGLRDTQCGFKLFRGEIARQVAQRQCFDGFAFDVEFLYLGRLLGARIREVPVRWYNSPASRVRVFQDSWRMFWDLLRIRWTHRGGRQCVAPLAVGIPPDGAELPS